MHSCFRRLRITLDTCACLPPFPPQAFRHQLSNASLLRRLGKAFQHAGDAALAENALRRSFTIDASRETAQLLSTVLISAGRQDDAQKILDFVS